jgi:lysophospholipase L1-like esterase
MRLRVRHRKLLYVAFALVVLLFLMDAAAGFATSRMKRTFDDLRLFANNPLAYTKLFVSDPLLFWRLRPLAHIENEGLAINALGLRGAATTVDKPAGAFRAICLGDSVTFGFKVRGEQSYPARLAALLGHAEVLNAGVPGYSSLQGVRCFRRDLMRLKPDLVIVSFGRNDLWDAMQMPDSEVPTYSPAVFAIRNWVWRRNITRLAAALFFRPASVVGGERRVGRCSPQETAANLAEIDRLARSAGARAVFFHPLMEGAPDLRLPGFGLDRSLPRIAVNEAFMRLAPDTRGLFFPDHCHPTAEGYEVLARAIAQELKGGGYLN